MAHTHFDQNKRSLKIKFWRIWELLQSFRIFLQAFPEIGGLIMNPRHCQIGKFGRSIQGNAFVEFGQIVD